VKLAILSAAPRCYSTRRLDQAAEARGHTVKVLNTLKFAIELSHGEPDLQYRGVRIDDYDAILPRIGASVTYFGASVVRQFEQMDVFTPNSSAGITNSRDKLRSLQILSRHDIGIPHTAFVRDRKDVLPAIERVGGAPVIIKLLEGTQGVGVILAESVKIAEAIIETLQSARQNVLIQKFVAESKGRDIRALVVGDRVVAAMRRIAQGQEFRSNVHRGAVAEAIELDEQYRETAVRAAQILGLRFAGVDLLESSAGPQVMEVNSSPGLEGIETSTGLDIAGAIVDYIAEQVNFPELDIRQRLTVSRGYGVAELQIPEGSQLVGKTIQESGLRERDIVVLTLHRGASVISNPRGSRALEGGDRLLCYGRTESMKDLVASRRKRKRIRVRRLDPDVGAGQRRPDEQPARDKDIRGREAGAPPAQPAPIIHDTPR
jgi:ribosomal protein S6--L-glutamate ligase